MAIIGILLLILLIVCSLTSIVCWILTLIKMFQDQENGGVGHGIGGIICGLYAFIWGWMHSAKHNHKGVMLAWTAVFAFSLILQVISGIMGAAAGGF